MQPVSQYIAHHSRIVANPLLACVLSSFLFTNKANVAPVQVCVCAKLKFEILKFEIETEINEVWWYSPCPT